MIGKRGCGGRGGWPRRCMVQSSSAAHERAPCPVPLRVSWPLLTASSSGACCCTDLGRFASLQKQAEELKDEREMKVHAILASGINTMKLVRQLRQK